LHSSHRYLKPAELIPRPPVDPRDRDGDGEGDERPGGKGKRVRGTFKKRPIDAVADAADLLCRAVAAGGACNFSETCKYSHDVDDYMKRKEKDLGDACPLFTAFQYCRYGVTCRFARAHTAQADGTHRNVDERPADERSVEDPTMLHETNALTDAVRMQLRKNTYPFASAQQNKKNKFQKGKPQNRNQEKAEQAAAAAAEGSEDVQAEVEEVVVQETKPAIDDVEKSESPLLPERKPVDFNRKIYVAPLTTVGNLPFRRLMKQLGADITCGEMAMATNLLKAQQSEWALLRRHESEDVFGVQLAGAYGDQMARVCELLARETDVDFIDINMGCPIDIVCKAGAGSALMTRPPRLLEVVSGALTGIELGSRERVLSPPGLTVKLRTGWSDKTPVAHKLLPKIQATRASSLYMNASVVQDYKLRAAQSVDAVTVHGRSRLQRYTRNADWDYVFDCSDALESDGTVAVVGGGDVMSFQEFDDHLKNGKLATCMIARGALIKPWLPTEIKERRHMDISSSERLELLKDFVRFGLEHWGSDQKGVNRTRRYLLEWQSFLCRYIPVGLLEVLPQRINSRPAPYYGRDDLETLMASDQAVDWIKISEMLLGPVPSGFQFQPKHKANAYTTA
jgi:tRNA-dihydrouridine synthase 3